MSYKDIKLNECFNSSYCVKIQCYKEFWGWGSEDLFTIILFILIVTIYYKEFRGWKSEDLFTIILFMLVVIICYKEFGG